MLPGWREPHNREDPMRKARRACNHRRNSIYAARHDYYNGIAVRGPLSYRLFNAIVNRTHASSEEDNRWQARLVRWSVVAGVRIAGRLRGFEFPVRSTGGWYWVWRWKFEFLMRWLEW